MRFPSLPHLGLQATEVDFAHARKLDMYQYLSGDSWAYEPDVLSILLCLLGQNGGGRFINVGANIGYFPILAKKLFGGQLDVYAYEPMPELLERLKKAQRRNRIELQLSGAALSDFTGTAPFHLSARSDTSNSLNPDFRPAKNVIDVRVTTLDDEFPEPRHRRPFRGDGPPEQAPTVLLIDTESTEPAVLRGGLALIDRVQPAIICEVLAGRTEDELSDIIEQIGYVAYALTDDGPERRDELAGDRTYQHRDWLFLPRTAAEPSHECFMSTMQVLAATGS